jgi:hypothetical protein
LVEQELELEIHGGTTQPDSLCTGEKEIEQCAMKAGRKTGVKTIQTFDKAWENTTSK